MTKYLLPLGKVIGVVVLGALGAWGYLQVLEYRQTVANVSVLIQLVQAHEALLRQKTTGGVPTIQAVQGQAAPAAPASPVPSPAAAPSAPPPTAPK